MQWLLVFLFSLAHAHGHTLSDIISSMPDRIRHRNWPGNWEDRLTSMQVVNGKLEVKIEKCYKGYD